MAITIEIRVDDVETEPAAAGQELPAQTPARRRRLRFPWKRLSMSGLVVAMLGVNGWWYWRDVRPVANLPTIANWLRDDRVNDAETSLREIIRRSPANDEARIMLARALGAKEDLLGCARELHEIPFWSIQKVDALYREGITYAMLNRAKDAEAAWTAILKDDPLHPAPSKIFHDAAAKLLELYAIEDRWDDAFSVIWRAFDEAEPADRPTLLTWRVRSELERLDYATAIKSLSKFVAADPEDWEALHALARAEMGVNLRDDARVHYKACLAGRPEDPRVWRDYLTMLYEIGDQDAWLAELARVPEAAESEPEIWKFRGIVKERGGDFEGAAADYREAIKRNPYILDYQYRLAGSDERIGKHEQAVEHLETTRRLREARSELRTAFANYLRADGAQSPDLNAATKRLSEICRTLGYSRAADEFARLIKEPVDSDG